MMRLATQTSGLSRAADSRFASGRATSRQRRDREKVRHGRASAVEGDESRTPNRRRDREGAPNASRAFAGSDRPTCSGAFAASDRNPPACGCDFRRTVERINILPKLRAAFNRCCSLTVPVAFLLFTAVAHAQFPDGPGKAEMTKVCSGCHELERAASMHQDRDAWRTTFDKMIALGAKGTE